MPKKFLTLKNELLSEAGIPKAFWKLDADTYEGSPKALLQIGRYIRQSRYALNKGLGLVIRGPSDSYKTFLVTYILKCLLAQGHDCLYSKIKEVTDVHFSKDLDFYLAFEQPSFLAIDDAMGAPNKGEEESFLRLVKMRKDEGKPILLATTYTNEQIAHFYGDSVLTYFRQRCSFVEVEARSFELQSKMNKLREPLENVA